MSRILVSGLVNTETTVKVREFPIKYYPIDYPFFGVDTKVSGVAYNVVKALKTLGDEITLTTMLGRDFAGEYILKEMEKINVDTGRVKHILKQTPASVVLYDEEGKRQIYCDLKDIQETDYGFSGEEATGCDIVIACNINFNRKLLRNIKNSGVTVATDVHVLSDIFDDYNKEFMANANILFLSDEGIKGEPKDFLMNIENEYGNDIIVLGKGAKGALMYVKTEDKFYEVPAVKNDNVVNTVGAGDALFSAFVHYYSKNMSPLEALKRACTFASIKIGFNGAAVGFAKEAQVEERLLSKK